MVSFDLIVMKRITIAVLASMVIYAFAFTICRATGSGVLNSGPLDWLFNLLVTPGFYVANRFGIESGVATVVLCWALYAPLLVAAIALAIKISRRRRFS